MWQDIYSGGFMVIYDSVMKKKVEFIPQKSNEVRIYLCGPTVYDDAHLGHARSAIVFDILRRILKVNSYNVIFVRNFTDIDDKIVKKSKDSNISINDITNTYINRYLDDMRALNVDSADIEPRVTDNLDSIFDMINNLLNKNKAYVAENGDIYMRVSSDDKYGSISNRIDTASAISRIEDNKFKADSRDFALWKIFDKSDIGYDSPFGYGRPGWHIECSALIQKYLSYKDESFSIDIHAGGSDLLFPHHENEASQSRCVNNKELSKYWMHNGFVNIDGEKMSKSSGNSYFIKDALKIYNGEVLRYYLMSTHYRATLNFSHNDLMLNKKRLDKLYRLKNRIRHIIDSQEDTQFKSEFINALNDDINVSLALSNIDLMIAKYNDLIDKNPKDITIKQMAKYNIDLVNIILGIGMHDSVEYFHLGVDDKMKRYIEEQIKIRNDAKLLKNYALSDEIRDELSKQGISLLDTKDGVVWEFNDGD